jgi:hypothetical protein
VWSLNNIPKSVLEYRRYSFTFGNYRIAPQIFTIAEVLNVPLFVILREEVPGTLIGICNPVREGGYNDLVFVSEEEYQEWLKELVQ